MGLLSRLRGDDITLEIDQAEDGALTRDNVPAAWLPYGRAQLLDVGRHNALRVVDAYACVRVLADAVASLPPQVYRQTLAVSRSAPRGRLAALLQIPTPGGTSADLFGLVMVYLNVCGNAYVGKLCSWRASTRIG